MKKKSFVFFYLIYTALFAAMVYAVFHAFFEANATFVNMADAFRQHLKALAYYSKWMRGVLYHLFKEHSFDLQTYSLGMGYGTDIYPTLQYYAIGDLLNLPVVFVKNQYIYIYFQIVMMLRPYLAGITFSMLVFYLRPKASKVGVMAGMFSYALCTFFMFLGIWHPFFANPLIYFPLVILGAEKIIRENKSALFAVSIFLAGSNNFFFFYMMVLLTIVYVIIRVAFTYGKDMPKWGQMLAKFMISGVIGTMMAMITLLPVIMAFPANPRVSTGIRLPLFYTKTYYHELIRNFFSFVYHGLYDTQIGLNGIILLPFILLIVKLVCSLIFRAKDESKKQKDKIKSRWQLFVVMAVLILFVCIPAAGYALTGFAYTINRWTFAFALASAFMLVDLWDDLFTMDVKEIAGAIIIGALFILICRNTHNLEYANARTELVIAGIALIVCCIVSLAGSVIRSESGNVDPKKKTPLHFIVKESGETIILAATLVAIVFNGYYGYDPNQGNMIREYYTDVTPDDMHILLESTEVQAVMEAAEATGTEKDSFYRYTGRDMVWNASLIEGISSTQFYWSLANGVVSDYFKEMGNNDQQNFAYYALDDRTILNSLAGVRYYSLRFNTEEEWRYVPFGYAHIHDRYNFAIFENQAPMSLGYTYYSIIPESEYQSIPTVNRQEALLYGAVVEDGKSSLSYAEPEYSLINCPIELSFEGEIQPEDGKWVVDGDASVHIKFSGAENCETYLWFDELYVNDAATDYPLFTVKALAQGNEVTHKDIWYKTEDNQFYSDWHDYFLNMGYAQGAKDEIVINFTIPGTYCFDDLGVYCQPMDNYVKQLGVLRTNMLTDIELYKNPISYATNKITGNITLEDTGIMCLTLPYCKGWTAYVDGQKSELLKVNTMFMGLEMPAGNHEIVLKYHTPGLLPGFILMVLGIVLLVVLVKYEKKRN
ncbi:YfhO family protein [Butyrivibrio sp. VCB2006]|uniref:YfhO family protein n=1 Tax=Butyrivibrio sp. VCB2006 TaxID=1280679 RepID=UPI0004172991|nr:YfhO family protein [Butyrivibrio sp. VCB2006]